MASPIDWSVVNDVVKKACRDLKSANMTKVKDALNTLGKIDEETSMETDRKLFADKLAELKFAELAKKIFTSINSQNISQRDFDEIACTTISIFVHITNYSPEICDSVAEKGLHEILVKEARQNFGAIAREGGNILQELRKNKLESCLVVLHNVMRLNPNCKQSMRDIGIQELMTKVIKSSSGFLQVVAVITLTVAVDENCSSDLIKVSIMWYG